jgi:hypothetical protein
MKANSTALVARVSQSRFFGRTVGTMREGSHRRFFEQ